MLNSITLLINKSPSFVGKYTSTMPYMEHMGYGMKYGSHRIDGAGIYANIGGILMGSMLPYVAYMDPMGNN
jgi:hypothetical protein